MQPMSRLNLFHYDANIFVFSGPQGSPGPCQARGIDLGFEATGIAGSANVPWEITTPGLTGVAYDFSSTALGARQGNQIGLVTYGALGARAAGFDQQHIIVCPNTTYTFRIVSQTSYIVIGYTNLSQWTYSSFTNAQASAMGCSITYSMGTDPGHLDLVATTTVTNGFNTFYQQTTGTFSSGSRTDVALYIYLNCPSGTAPLNGYRVIFDDITFTNA
jgi:hypothetical protein